MKYKLPSVILLFNILLYSNINYSLDNSSINLTNNPIVNVKNEHSKNKVIHSYKNTEISVKKDEINKTLEDCLPPTNIEVENITATSALVKWDASTSNTTKYDVYYQKKGDTHIPVTYTANSVLLNNLEPNTIYYIWIKSVCGTVEGSWAPAKQFKTPCKTLPTPFTEGFNSDSETYNCWTIVNGSADKAYWKRYNKPNKNVYEGNRSMTFRQDKSWATSDSWMISPTVKVKGKYKIKYYYKTVDNGVNEFEVLLSKDGKDLSKFTQTLVAKKSYKTSGYEEETIIVKDLDGEISIAWHATGKGSSHIYIDKVSIEKIDDCVEPLEFGVKGIKNNQATIYWEINFEATKWEYIVKEANKAAPSNSDSGTTTEENEIIITKDNEGTDLKAETEYVFYVRTICANGKSNWSEPYKFKTDCDTFTTFPFWEGFNSDSPTLKCWTIIDGNNDKKTWRPWFLFKFEGDQTMEFSTDSNSSENDEWLISPSLKMNGSYRIKYNLKIPKDSQGTNEFEVLLSKNGKETSEFKQILTSKKSYGFSEYEEKKAIVSNMVGDVNIAWHANGIGKADMSIDNIIIEKIENCPEPLDLDIKDLSHDKATLSWYDEFGGTSWEYFIQTSGKGKPTKKGSITSSKENIVTTENETGGNLLDNTEYEYYVRTICDEGGNSIWSGPFVFRTACSTYDLPFWEGFNTNSKYINCWNFVDKDGDNNSWETSNNYYEGNRAMSFNKSDNTFSYESDDWLISPTLKADGGTYMIKYHYKTSNMGASELEILMSNNGIDTNEFKTEVLKKSIIGSPNYAEKVIFIDDLNGDINFAWRVTSKGPSQLHLDNIHIEKVGDCPEPYYINITKQTANTISIEWEQTGNVDKWEAIAIPYGEKIPKEEDLIIQKVNKKAKATFTGLESGKVYTFYVRAICNNTQQSNWSSGVTAAIAAEKNNGCSEAYNIPVNDNYNCELFTTASFAGSGVSTTSKKICDDLLSPNTDIWLEFTAKDNFHILNISDFTSPSNMGIVFNIAIYKEDCSGSDAPIYCFQINKTGNRDADINKIPDLEIGKKYYLRIYSNDSNADYYFKLCINSPKLIVKPIVGEKEEKEAEINKLLMVNSECNLISNIKYQAGDGSSNINTMGYFKSRDSSFPFEEGIVLTTNSTEQITGPYDGFAVRKNRIPFWIGDAEINEVIEQVGGPGLNNEKAVAVLEFDFIPVNNTMKFEYIFASDSYHKKCYYVCQPAAGLFAAWLTDAETGIGQNLALIPGTDEPIATSTIRDTKRSGTTSCYSSHEEFYWKNYDNNQDDPIEAFVNYSGVTVPMSSETVTVIPGKKYHIKLAIADYCDKNYKDASAVFFKARSFDISEIHLGEDRLISNNNALCIDEEEILDTKLDKDLNTIKSFKWLKDGIEIPEENDSKLKINSAGNYEVIVNYENLECPITSAIKIEYYPKVVPPKDINYCENSINNEKVVDITTNEQIMFGNLDKSDYQVSYYLTKEDSENEENEIKNTTQFEVPENGKSIDIYIRIFNTKRKCIELTEFKLVPQKLLIPIPPKNTNVCYSYTFGELPENQHYFTEEGAKGIEYKAGDVIDKVGTYTIYICSITEHCFDEISFDIEISVPEEIETTEIQIPKCENYVLPNLPSGSRYFTEADSEGTELFEGEIIRLNKTIYIYTVSEENPEYCHKQSALSINLEECEIPKGISPNGDGYNDSLDLEVHGVTSIVIYNRYGTEVYTHGAGYINQWKGQDNNGNNLPDGTYYYVIEARGKVKTGWIQINK